MLRVYLQWKPLNNSTQYVQCKFWWENLCTLGSFREGLNVSWTLKGRSGLEREKKRRKIILYGEKSGMNKDLEAIESKSRKMKKGSRKQGLTEYVKNILGRDFTASLCQGVWILFWWEHFFMCLNYLIWT